MNSTSKICRDLLDTRDIIKAQIAEVLVSELVGAQKISRDECGILLPKLNQHVDNQVDRLVDRILVVEAEEAAAVKAAAKVARNNRKKRS